MREAQNVSAKLFVRGAEVLTDRRANELVTQRVDISGGVRHSACSTADCRDLPTQSDQALRWPTSITVRSAVTSSLRLRANAWLESATGACLAASRMSSSEGAARAGSGGAKIECNDSE